jgi:hypothetical protein
MFISYYIKINHCFIEETICGVAPASVTDSSPLFSHLGKMFHSIDISLLINLNRLFFVFLPIYRVNVYRPLREL